MNTYDEFITYITDGDGVWEKITGGKQCSCEGIFDQKCQGVSGHMGCHWCYEEDGSYHYWKNEADPSSIEENIASGSIPPEHDSYVEPSSKVTEHYRKFYVREIIKDVELIEQLEKGITPEENAAIDRPCILSEIEALKTAGRI